MGQTVSEIARILGVDKKAVRLWKERGESDVQDSRRTGRPTVLSPRTKTKIRKMVENKPGIGTRTAAKRISQSENYQQRQKNVSRSTVQRYVKSTNWGRHAYVKPIKPLLTEKNIRDKLSFCTRIRNEGFCEDSAIGRAKRANILFTDESPMVLHPTPNRQNVRTRTSDPSLISPVQKPKFDLKIMVAGGISSRGKSGLHIVTQNSTVDGAYYRENILQIYAECLQNRRQFPDATRFVLMQDGARAHTAKATLTLAKTIFSTVWEDWPGNSPDLNPIEHVWARLQDSVFRQPIPKNRRQLIERVQQEWSNYTSDDLNNLCDSFGRRILECLENNGRHTHY